MTPKETSEAAAVMLHHAAGGKVRFRSKGSKFNNWYTLDKSDAIWNWDGIDYEIVEDPVEYAAWFSDANLPYFKPTLRTLPDPSIDLTDTVGGHWVVLVPKEQAK